MLHLLLSRAFKNPWRTIQMSHSIRIIALLLINWIQTRISDKMLWTYRSLDALSWWWILTNSSRWNSQWWKINSRTTVSWLPWTKLAVMCPPTSRGEQRSSLTKDSRLTQCSKSPSSRTLEGVWPLQIELQTPMIITSWKHQCRGSTTNQSCSKIWSSLCLLSATQSNLAC